MEIKHLCILKDTDYSLIAARNTVAVVGWLVGFSDLLLELSVTTYS